MKGVGSAEEKSVKTGLYSSNTTKPIWVVCGCGTTWPTWSEIWPRDLKGDPWSTMVVLEPFEVDPLWPTIHALQNQEAWLKEEQGSLVDTLTGTHCLTWSEIRTPHLEGDPGVTCLVGVSCGVGPICPVIQKLKFWEPWGLFKKFSVLVGAAGPSRATWCQIRTIEPVVGPWETLEIRSHHGLGRWDPLTNTSIVPGVDCLVSGNYGYCYKSWKLQ